MITIAQPIIANPMYDTVFKRMMKNERMARFFLGTLLGKTIEKLGVGHDETTWLAPQDKVLVLRASKGDRPIVVSQQNLDFVALVKTDEGCEEMPINIHKLGHHYYLGHLYKDLFERYKNKSVSPPVTSIYVTEFILPEIESACVRIGKTCEDLVNAKPLDGTNLIVALLRNDECDAYVIQPKRIVANRCQTELDKLLGIFEQANFTNDYPEHIVKQYRHPIDNEDLRDIVDFLHYLITDPDERKVIELEHESWRTFDAHLESMATMKEWEEKERKTREREEREVTEKAKEVMEKEREETKKVIENVQQVPDGLVQLKNRES